MSATGYVGNAAGNPQLYVQAATLGVPGGVATLDGGGQVSASQVSGVQASTKAYTDTQSRITVVPKRPTWRVASYNQIFAAGHGWIAGGGGLATANANDTATFVKGVQSTQATSNSTTTQVQIRKLAQPTMDLTGKALRLVFRVADVTNLDRIDFVLGSGNLANFFRWLVHTHSAVNPNFVQSGEWVTVTLNWASVSSASGTNTLTAGGLPNTKTGFTDMQFAFYGNGGGPVTVNLQSVEIIPDITATFPGGVVSITFDDSFSSPYDLARPKMDTLGYRGTVFNIIDTIGTAAHFTLQQIHNLQDTLGWEVGAHALTQANHTASFTGLTYAQVLADLRGQRQWLQDNGFYSETLAYPKGQFGLTTDGYPVDQIAARFFAQSRAIIGENVETFPPAMPQRVRSITGINDGTGLGGTTVAALTAAGGPLDRCSGSGNWLVLTFHKIVTGTPADSTEISQTGFNTVMDAINSRNIPVLPLSDVMRNYS